jgi:hypothetical protein
MSRPAIVPTLIRSGALPVFVAAILWGFAAPGCSSDESSSPAPAGSGGAATDASTGGNAGAAGIGGSSGAAGQSGSAGAGGAAGQSGGAGAGGAAGQSGGAGAGGTAGQAGSAGTSGTGGNAGSANTASGVIIPLYTYPSDSTWDTVVAAKSAHPTVDIQAIINPDSGPGTSKDSEYVSGIAKLSAAKVLVLGYVATGYASVAEADVQSQMDDYKSWYPGVTGIFFDEMQSAAGDEAYYTSLTQYAKSHGFVRTVGNPGTDVEASYVGTVDTIFIYETDGLPTLSSLGGWHTNHDKKNFGIIPYAVPALDASFMAGARPLVGYIYITDDDLPNPWDSLPPYFGALVTALE